jgi:hypothetical protein
MKRLFIQYFQPFVASFVASLHSVNVVTTVNQATSWDFISTFQHWDMLFDKLLKGLEEKASQVCLLIAFPETIDLIGNRIANHACVRLFESQSRLPLHLLMTRTPVIYNIIKHHESPLSLCFSASQRPRNPLGRTTNCQKRGGIEKPPAGPRRTTRREGRSKRAPKW